MKEFNLEKALAGNPVIDDGGNPAIYLTTVVNRNVGSGHYFKLRAGTNYEEVRGFNSEGSSLCPSLFSSSLHMTTIKKTVWVNVWDNGYGTIVSSPKPYDSEKLAIESYAKNEYQTYFGAHPIEIEI